MTQSPQHEPDSPDPRRTPGLEPGGGVAPGDTPPDAGQLSGAARGDREGPNLGPVSGNRTPMLITLVVLGVIVVLFAGYAVAGLIG